MNSKIRDFLDSSLTTILQGRQPLPDSITHILEQVASSNLQKTFSSISTIHSILNLQEQSTELYFRALQTIKYIVQTCNYAALMLVQVYLLPMLVETVSKYRESAIFSEKSSSLSGKSQKRELRFGGWSNKAITELIILAAYIKPYRIAAQSELNQQSAFQVAKSQLSAHHDVKLSELAVKKYEKLREKYLDNIKDLGFSQRQHSLFLLAKWQEFSKNKAGQQLLPVTKLFQQGEYYLISAFLHSFSTIIKAQAQIQESLQYQYVQLFSNLASKGYIEVIATLLDHEFSLLLSNRIWSLESKSRTNESQLLNSYKSVQRFRGGLIKTLNCQVVEVQNLPALLCNININKQGGIYYETVEMFAKNSLRNTKIANYLHLNCHKYNIIVSEPKLINKRLIGEKDSNEQNNVQTVRIDDYEVEELSEADIRNKKQKKLASTPLYNSKMNSNLASLRQNLPSKHSKDSKISKRSVGKSAGIKLYSQLMKQRKEGSHQQNNSIHQSNPTIQQSVQKVNNSSIVDSIANISVRKSYDSKLLKDNQEKSNYQQQNSQADLIQTPDLKPQRNSYYMENDQTSVLKNNVLSFKAALQQKHEGIDARQKEICLIQQASVFRNVVKSPKAGGKLTKHSEYMPTSSSKTSKFMRQDMVMTSKNESLAQSKSDNKLSLRQNPSEIALLQEKLKKLQKQKLLMQTQLAIRNNELGNLKASSVYGSQKNLVFYQTPSDSEVFPTRQSRQRQLRAMKFRKEEDSQFQKEIEVKYQPFFKSLRGNTGRKNLLRSKCLVENSEELQFGLLSQLCPGQSQRQVVLELTLFFTFHKFDSLEFSLSFLQNSAFTIAFQSRKPMVIKLKKQEKVSAKIRLLSFPFDLPEIQVNFKTHSQYNFKNVLVTLPLSFNKFVHVNAIKHGFQPVGDCLRTNIFPFNAKNIPVDKILQFLPGWSNLKQERKGQLICLGVACSFEQTRFNVIIRLSEKGCVIEGYLLAGEAKAVQFYVCTLKNIFELQRK